MIGNRNGPPCPGGQRGCWERFASGTGLARLAREAAEAGRLEAVTVASGGDPDMVRGEHVTSAAAVGDAEAKTVLAEFAWWIGLGLAHPTHVLDPATSVLGGGRGAAAEPALPGGG